MKAIDYLIDQVDQKIKALDNRDEDAEYSRGRQFKLTDLPADLQKAAKVLEKKKAKIRALHEEYNKLLPGFAEKVEKAGFGLGNCYADDLDYPMKFHENAEARAKRISQDRVERRKKKDQLNSLRGKLILAQIEGRVPDDLLAKAKALGLFQ